MQFCIVGVFGEVVEQVDYVIVDGCDREFFDSVLKV